MEASYNPPPVSVKTLINLRDNAARKSRVWKSFQSRREQRKNASTRGSAVPLQLTPTLMCFRKEQTAAIVSCLEDSIHLLPVRVFRRVPASHHGFHPRRLCNWQKVPSIRKLFSGHGLVNLGFFFPCFFELLQHRWLESLCICNQEESRRRNNEGFQANPRCVPFNLLPLNYIITYKKAHTLSKQRLLTS